MSVVDAEPAAAENDRRDMRQETEERYAQRHLGAQPQMYRDPADDQRDRGNP
jgi:hypothetical protein